MTGKLRELVAWELQESWIFPILELILAVTIIQVLPFFIMFRDDGGIINSISMPFWKSMVFVFAVSAAVVFGRSFGESIEKRKLVVLLGYPVSRFQIFVSKFLANLLGLLCVFGFALLAEGILAWMFEPSITWGFYQEWYASFSIAPAVWGFMFVALFLVVFFTSSLMSFLALATKRFGLSVLVFLVYVFGLEYWTGTLGNKAPAAYLSLVQGPIGIVNYLSQEYHKAMGLGIVGFGTSWPLFLTALSYLLIGGLVLLCASLVLVWRMDLD